MSISLIFAKQAFQSRRANAYRLLAFALGKGASPMEEFEALLKTAKERKSRFVPIYHEWLTQLTGSAAGKMALSMRNTIPASEYALLASAEQTGRMKEGLEFMAGSVSQIEEMRSAISRALTSVMLPVLLLVSLIWGVDQYFFPSVEESVARKSWPFLSKVVADMAHHIGSIVAAGVVVVPVLLMLWIWSLPRLTGPWRRVLEMTVFYNKYRDYMCCIFLVNLQFLMDAGHSPLEALERIAALSNGYMKWHIEKMLHQIVTRSINVGDALLSTGLFNRDLAELMSNYARWADWHEQIGSIAKSALKIVTDDVSRLGPSVQAWLKLAVGGILLVVFGAGALALSKVLLVGLN